MLMRYIRVKEANCKNCYKCLKHGAVKSISYINDRVEVIEDGCILCGRCINVCPQKAKTVVNDPAAVLGMLADPGVRTVASLAPSYIGVYGRENRGRFIAALKALGFDEVQETALGAHEVSLRYKELLDAGEMPAVLGTCCPAVNDLIVKYYPSLTPLMAPVVSPALAHGRLIKQEQGADTRVVFVGPCLAKIKEIAEHPESADAVLSFRMLDKLLADRGIDPAGLPEDEAPLPAPFSRIYPIPEGVVRDVRGAAGTESSAYNGYRFMSVCGLENVMEFLKELEAGHIGRVFAELNACDGGCVNGPLIAEDKRAAYRSLLEVESYAEASAPIESRPIALGQAFEAEPLEPPMPDEATIRKILTEIGKPTPDKELNCGSCGYPTCRDKAIAVYQKKAELYMCLPYINDLSQSLSNVTLSVSPNLILAVDRDLRIVELNLTAQKLFGVTRQMALKADLYEFMDPADFEEVFQTHRNILDKKVKLDPLNIITSQTLIYVPDQELVMGFIKDITEEEQAKEKNFRARLESAEMAQKVIEKQMIAAQEIASLLGETTAETKVTLNLLKDLMLDEAGSADRKG